MTVTGSTLSNNLLDVFGSPFRFFIDSKKAQTFKTAVGGLSTATFIIFCSLALFIFGRKFLDRSQAIVSVNTKTQTRDHYYDTYDNDVYVAFSLFDGQIFPKTENTLKFMTLRAQRETTYLVQKDIQVKRKIEDPFPMVKCEYLSHNMSDLTTQAFSLDSGRYYRGAVFCGDIRGKTNWWLQGSPLELPYTMIRYRLYPCSLDNAADCASVTELAASTILVPLFLKSVDYYNYSNPLKHGLDADVTLNFNVITKTKLTFWFKDTTIHDDKIDFFGEFGDPNKFIELDKVTTTIGTRNGALHCSDIQIEDGSCDPYLEIEVRVSTAHTVVERRYYTFLTMVSEVGGFGDLIFLSLLFVTTWYNQYWQVKWIREQLYSDLIKTINDEKRKREQIRQLKRIGSGVNQGLDGAFGGVSKAGDGGSSPSKRIFKPQGRAQNRAICKAESKPKTKNGEAESRKGTMEELRVEFDTFEFMAASKKSSILEHLYLKPFHNVLLPHLLYSLRMSRKNPNKTRKLRNAMRSLFNKRALAGAGNHNDQSLQARRASADTVSLEDKLHSTFMKILSLKRAKGGLGASILGNSSNGQPGGRLGLFGGLQRSPAKNPRVMFNSQQEGEEKGAKNPKPNFFESLIKMASKNKKQEIEGKEGLEKGSIQVKDLESIKEEQGSPNHKLSLKNDSPTNQAARKSLAKDKKEQGVRKGGPRVKAVSLQSIGGAGKKIRFGSSQKMVFNRMFNNNGEKNQKSMKNSKKSKKFGSFSQKKSWKVKRPYGSQNPRKISTKFSEKDISIGRRGVSMKEF